VYPLIPCQLVTDPLVSAEHTSGTTGLVVIYVPLGSTLKKSYVLPTEFLYVLLYRSYNKE